MVFDCDVGLGLVKFKGECALVYYLIIHLCFFPYRKHKGATAIISLCSHGFIIIF